MGRVSGSPRWRWRRQKFHWAGNGVGGGGPGQREWELGFINSPKVNVPLKARGGLFIKGLGLIVPCPRGAEQTDSGIRNLSEKMSHMKNLRLGGQSQ